jgi:hypothetical protein
MSGERKSAPALSVQVPGPTTRNTPAMPREGVIAIGATTVGVLALGALAVGAVAIGKLALGRLAVGWARPDNGQVDDLHIVRLAVTELRVDRVL